MDMTISQALRRINKLQGEVAVWRGRAEKSLTYYEPEKPAFEFDDCMRKLNDINMEMLQLQTAVAFANATTNLEFDGRTVPLAGAVRSLQELRGQIKWLRELTTFPQERTTTTEVAYVVGTDGDMKRANVTKIRVCELAEADQAAAVDKAQASFDFLNDLVERMNQQTQINVG